MPIENAKVLEIVLEEVDGIDDRCPGYKDELKDAIAEIIEAERTHRIQKTRIQQIVEDKCQLAGQVLSSKRRESGKE